MNIRDLGDLYLKDIVLASRILSCVLPMGVRKEKNVLGYAPYRWVCLDKVVVH
jgi:hypothetical protein